MATLQTQPLLVDEQTGKPVPLAQEDGDKNDDSRPGFDPSHIGMGPL